MSTKLSTLTRIVIGLEFFLALGAYYGGAALIAAPDGSLLGVPVEALSGTPFSSYLIPGLVLFICIGVLPTTAAIAALRRQNWARTGHLAVGVVLVGFELVEVLALGFHFLQAIYLVYGVVLIALGWVVRKDSS